MSIVFIEFGLDFCWLYEEQKDKHKHTHKNQAKNQIPDQTMANCYESLPILFMKLEENKAQTLSQNARDYFSIKHDS